MFSTVFKDDDDVVIGKVFMQVWKLNYGKRVWSSIQMPSCLKQHCQQADVRLKLTHRQFNARKCFAGLQAALGWRNHVNRWCIF